MPEELPVVAGGGAGGHGEEAKPQLHPDAGAAAAAALAAAPGAGFPAAVPWDPLVNEDHKALLQPTLSTPLPNSLRWYIMLPILICGVVLSDTILYGMGRYWGPKLLEKRWSQRLLPPDKRAKIEDNFHKYGVLVLLFARFLPAIRSPIFIMAGIMRVPFTRFLLADGLYALPGVSLLFYLSFRFGT